MNKRCLLILLCLVLMGACNSRGAYQSTQQQRQFECDRSPVDDERNRCATSDKIGYEDYQREREALKKGVLIDE